MSGGTQTTRLGDCQFCAAAYPNLLDEEMMTHSADPRMGALARVFAMTFQESDEPTDEQVGWFCQDADAVIDDHPDATSWTITDHVDGPVDPDDPDSPWHGIDHTFTINGVPYVLQAAEWEPSHPVKRETYLSWSEATS